MNSATEGGKMKGIPKTEERMPLEFETVVKEGKIQLPFKVNLEGKKVKVVLYLDEEDIIEHSHGASCGTQTWRDR